MTLFSPFTGLVLQPPDNPDNPDSPDSPDNSDSPDDPESSGESLIFIYAFQGGQALTRYVLDHPELVLDKRVLDFACGCGASV